MLTCWVWIEIGCCCSSREWRIQNKKKIQQQHRQQSRDSSIKGEKEQRKRNLLNRVSCK